MISVRNDVAIDNAGGGNYLLHVSFTSLSSLFPEEKVMCALFRKFCFSFFFITAILDICRQSLSYI